MNEYKTKIADLYLSWVNEFLTVARFAEYYYLEKYEAEQLIDMGRRFQDERAELYKEGLM